MIQRLPRYCNNVANPVDFLKTSYFARHRSALPFKIGDIKKAEFREDFAKGLARRGNFCHRSGIPLKTNCRRILSF